MTSKLDASQLIIELNRNTLPCFRHWLPGKLCLRRMQHNTNVMVKNLTFVIRFAAPAIVFPVSVRRNIIPADFPPE